MIRFFATLREDQIQEFRSNPDRVLQAEKAIITNKISTASNRFRETRRMVYVDELIHLATNPNYITPVSNSVLNAFFSEFPWAVEKMVPGKEELFKICKTFSSFDRRTWIYAHLAAQLDRPDLKLTDDEISTFADLAFNCKAGPILKVIFIKSPLFVVDLMGSLQKLLQLYPKNQTIRRNKLKHDILSESLKKAAQIYVNPLTERNEELFFACLESFRAKQIDSGLIPFIEKQVWSQLKRPSSRILTELAANYFHMQNVRRAVLLYERVKFAKLDTNAVLYWVLMTIAQSERASKLMPKMVREMERKGLASVDQEALAVLVGVYSHFTPASHKVFSQLRSRKVKLLPPLLKELCASFCQNEDDTPLKQLVDYIQNQPFEPEAILLPLLRSKRSSEFRSRTVLEMLQGMKERKMNPSPDLVSALQKTLPVSMDMIDCYFPHLKEMGASSTSS